MGTDEHRGAPGQFFRLIDAENAGLLQPGDDVGVMNQRTQGVDRRRCRAVSIASSTARCTPKQNPAVRATHIFAMLTFPSMHKYDP